MYIIGYSRIRVGSVLPFTYPLLSLPLTYPLFYSSAGGTFRGAKVLLYAHVRK